MTFNFDSTPSELLLQIFSYLNVRDAATSKSCSRRFLFLIEKLAELHPQLSISASSSIASALDAALLKLPSCRPNIAILFSRDDTLFQDFDGNASTSSLVLQRQRQVLVDVSRRLPRDTVVLSASATAIQSNLASRLSGNDAFAVVLASFPEATATPFYIPSASFPHQQTEMTVVGIEDDAAKLSVANSLASQIPDVEGQPDYYQTIVLFCELPFSNSGNGYDYCSLVAKILQERFPKASIIGGVCEGGDIKPNSNLSAGLQAHPPQMQFASSEDIDSTMSVKELKALIVQGLGPEALLGLIEKSEIRAKAKEANASLLALSGWINCDRGLFGLAFGGECPLKVVLGRGHQSLTTGEIPHFVENVNGGSTSSFATIHAAATCGLQISSPDSNVSSPEVYTYIKKVRTPNGEIVSPLEYFQQLLDDGRNLDEAQWIGFKRDAKKGFELQRFHAQRLNGDGLIVNSLEGEAEDSLIGAEFDLFGYSCEATIHDLNAKFGSLAEELEEGGEEVLGALMFSERAPTDRTPVNEFDMFCASIFNFNFPGVDLVGFYGRGEIGPSIRAAGCEDLSFGTNAEEACLQSGSAVVGVFVAPKTKEGKRKSWEGMSDSPELCADFARSLVLGAGTAGK